MKLATLHIQRFGARSNLRLDEISDQLSVVYGPNGSGKTTIIDFIRWMLYGTSEAMHHPAATQGLERAAGSLTVLDSGRHRTVSRVDDGSISGRVSFSDHHGVTGTAFVSTRLSGVDLDEYSRIFSVGFERVPSIEQLLNTAISHGFELTFDERQTQRLQELSLRLSQDQSEAARLAQYQTAAHWLDRKNAIQRDIAGLEEVKCQRLVERDRQRRELQSRMDAVHAERQHLRIWLDQIESAIDARGGQLAAVATEADRARQAWSAGRRQHVDEIDYQIQQWHKVLEVLRTRAEQLKSRLSGISASHVVPVVYDDNELCYFMRSLGYRIEEIEQDYILPYSRNGQHADDPAARYDYLRDVFGHALHAMRDDVTRLANQLQDHQQSALRVEHESEIRHLHGCEIELTDLIASLTKRRESLLAASEPWPYLQNTIRTEFYPRQTGLSNGSLVVPWYESNGHAISNGQHHSLDETGRSRTVRGFDPVLEARLTHLCARRVAALPRLRELESLLADLERQLRDCEIHLDEDRRIGQLQAELASIDEQLRLCHQYEQLLARARSTEVEIQDLRRNLRQSDIVQEASAILNRMTGGGRVAIRINQSREISIDEASGRRSTYAQLNRGLQDLVYVALCLALAAAYKRRGVEQSLILNDPFSNVDAAHAASTADVLVEFARHGHQVLVFTRHEHIVQLFEARGVKLYSLRPRLQPTPIITAPIIPATLPEYRPFVQPVIHHEPITNLETRYDWVTRWEVPTRPTTFVPRAEPIRHETRLDDPALYVADRPVRPAEVHSTSRFTPEVEPPRPVIGLAAPIDSVGLLDADAVRRLKELGVVNVGQFLQLDAADTSIRMNRDDIPAARIEQWRNVISLVVYVGVAPADAAILVACGIVDPEALAMADTDHLHRHLQAFLASPEARGRYSPTSRFDRNTVANWIEKARDSEYRRGAPVVRRFVDGREVIRDFVVSPKREVAQSPDAERFEVRAHQPDRFARRTRPAPARQERTEPHPQPARAAEAPTTEVPTVVAAQRGETLRFYLEPTDSIVDAPSIGPKTAERFRAIGVSTIAEFMAVDPTDAAKRIAYQRITSDVIREWQLQTQMVSRVPNLRGHDAQILIACGIVSAEQLAKADATELYRQVKRFCSTTEGKRILRNGAKPNQAEIASWIRWARSAREHDVTVRS